MDGYILLISHFQYKIIIEKTYFDVKSLLKFVQGTKINSFSYFNIFIFKHGLRLSLDAKLPEYPLLCLVSSFILASAKLDKIYYFEN